MAQENRVKKRTKTKDAQGYIDLKRKYGFWARKKNNIIRIRKVANLHSLIGVDIYTFNQNRKLISVVSAGSAKYEKGRWTLTDVRRSRLSEDEVQIARFKTMAWGKLIEPDQFKSLMVEPENQALSDLKKYIANLEANRTNADQYRLAYWIKIFKPFSTLVMMLIAIPFIFRTIRTTNTGQRLFFGVLIGLIFYMFNQGMNSVALVSGIPPVVSAALPSLIFGAIGIYFIRRVG